MKEICPMCNGLYEMDFKCVRCSDKMKDEGPIINYLDDYSPYLLDDISYKIDGVSSDKCVHLYQCISCEEDKKYIIERKDI